MERLSQRDIEALLAYLREIYVSSDLEGFASRVVATLPKLFPSDEVSYHEIDLPSRKVIAVVADPPVSVHPPETLEVLQQHIHEHPILNYYWETGDGRAVKTSDLLTKSQWHSLALYNEFYKEIRNIEHQLDIALPSPRPLMTGFALYRSRKDYSERDRLLFDLLRPHLVQAHQNAKALTQRQRASLRQAVEGSEQAVIVLSGKDRVQWCTEQARRWMGEYFEPAREVDRLPESLGRWVENQRSLLWGRSSIPPPCEPLIVKQAGKNLAVRFMADDPEEGSHLLVLEERYAPLSVGSFEALGLTGREAEILIHAARGKTNKEIAATLYVSPFTVKAHLEHAYRKLRVQSRTEALSRALQLL